MPLSSPSASTFDADRASAPSAWHSAHHEFSPFDSHYSNGKEHISNLPPSLQEVYDLLTPTGEQVTIPAWEELDHDKYQPQQQQQHHTSRRLLRPGFHYNDAHERLGTGGQHHQRDFPPRYQAPPTFSYHPEANAQKQQSIDNRLPSPSLHTDSMRVAIPQFAQTHPLLTQDRAKMDVAAHDNPFPSSSLSPSRNPHWHSVQPSTEVASSHYGRSFEEADNSMPGQQEQQQQQTLACNKRRRRGKQPAGLNLPMDTQVQYTREQAEASQMDHSCDDFPFWDHIWDALEAMQANGEDGMSIEAGSIANTDPVSAPISEADDFYEKLKQCWIAEVRRKKPPPFYLRNLPPNRVGQLFFEYEKLYWRLETDGDGVQGHFFVAPDDFSEEERLQFRKLARKFTDRIANWTRKKVFDLRDYRRRKYGPPRRPDLKTEAQQRESTIYTLKNQLNDKLRTILYKKIAGVQWTARDDATLQKLDAMTQLKSSDRTVQLYRKLLAISPSMVRCIPLPPL